MFSNPHKGGRLANVSRDKYRPPQIVHELLELGSRSPSPRLSSELDIGRGKSAKQDDRADQEEETILVIDEEIAAAKAQSGEAVVQLSSQEVANGMD